MAEPTIRRTPSAPRPSSETRLSPSTRPRALLGPADVVAAVPYLLGHEPAASLVAIGLRPGGQLGVVARVDVRAELLAFEPAATVAERVIVALVQDADSGVILASYDDTDPPNGPGVAAAAVLAAVRTRLPGVGVDAFDVLHVGPNRWRSLLCEDPFCCPASGSDVAETRSRPIAVDFVVGGRSPAADRDALEPESPRAPAAARRAATTAASRWRHGAGATQDLASRRFLLQDWVAVVDQHRCDGRLPSPGRSGRLAAGWVDDLRLRDACMVAVLPGAQLLPDALIAGVAADLAPVLAERACAGAVDLVSPVLRVMAGCLSGRELAGVLAVHAWLSWGSGSGGAAGDLARRALAAEPGHRLAELVAQLLHRAVPPDWAAPDQVSPS